MAKYRAIYRTIWKDHDFQLYTPEAKLIFIYLCTNEATSESGIYSITQKTISDETGIPLPTVAQLLSNSLRNVVYDMDNHCVFVRRFRKYNAGGKPDLIKLSILNDAKLIPRTKLWNEFIKEYPEFTEVLSTVMQPLTNSLPTDVGSGSGSSNGISKGNSNGKGNNSSNNNNDSPTVDNNEETIFKVYQDNFGLVTSSFVSEELKDIAKTYKKGWFEEAVKEAFLSAKNKPNLKYVISIMERWLVDGFKNPAERTHPYQQGTKKLKSNEQLVEDTKRFLEQ